MSRGPGKWQRMILEHLESMKDSADYRHVWNGRPGRSGNDLGLIERRYPELWEEKEYPGYADKNHPLEHGWVCVADLRKVCKAENMAAYKALLRALDTLEADGKIECSLITGRDRRRLARLLSVDCCPPLDTSVNT